ncbi:pyrroline-5-carboxylate reductase [Burkholderia multivorans]|nr:pyrroline-5-carboxylate reductase [Burkholderia multivorans]MCA8143538.1 NAD(P)-binding domain-containing protein [Burkholderia multivorans]MCO1368548.1 pyrroline-5-carboxylate reductase [Burkholderia multivorans]MCO1380439.1 pyrroline-5-carboxylate reductase [Burkholderia multivorans]UQP22085.1 pyrroline-5-carboxylate reductase [Burkholderia multivorans]UQP92177.1 pyrroline-5-carboxylate reductase [Burkholderia multivorans]
MRLGFVGTGVITEAIVNGLLKVGAPFDRIALSNRNARKAAALAAQDERISVCETNQDVLDQSDVVCLAVIPQIAHDVIAELKFAPSHRVISFIAGMKMDELRRAMPNVDSIVRAIPLPAVADALGSTTLFPQDGVARDLFSRLGVAVEVENEHQFDCISAATATMASFYAVLESQAQWLVQQGLAYDKARAFLSGYSRGLAHGTASGAPFDELIRHCMTPGGINEQVHLELTDRGNYGQYQEALTRVLNRIEGTS